MRVVTAEDARRDLRESSSEVFVAVVRADESEGNLQTDFGARYSAKLRDTLQKFGELFQEPTSLPPRRAWDHKIELETEDTPAQPTYRMSPQELQEVKN